VGNASTLHPNSIRIKLKGGEKESRGARGEQGRRTDQHRRGQWLQADFSASLNTIILLPMTSRAVSLQLPVYWHTTIANIAYDVRIP